MKTAAALLAGALLMTPASAADPLAGFRWKARVLLVFGQGDAARIAAQDKALASAGAGLAERDLTVLRVPKTGPAGSDGVTAAALRRAFAIADDAPFTVLLVGKDGGVKRRDGEPFAAPDLFATIDAMPMRAQEMRRR